MACAFINLRFRWNLIGFLTILLLPAASFGQGGILEFLRVEIRPDEPMDHIKVEYAEDKDYNHNLRIPYRTKYRFQPEGGDSGRAYCFNVDSSKKVCSIVILVNNDTVFLERVAAFLGTPARNMSMLETRTIEWLVPPFNVEFIYFDERKYLIIYRSNGHPRDFFKYGFK